MIKSAFETRVSAILLPLGLVVSAFILTGCGVEAARTADKKTAVAPPTTNADAPTETTVEAPVNPGTIEFEENSPADTVRAFYAHLRGNRLRDAIFLTNLRPGIEGLTDSEIADLNIDLKGLSQTIPEDIKINGEIMSDDYATVTARLPNNETSKVELQKLRLRREGNYWVILTVEEASEPVVKREGSKYFFNLRIRTHESEAQAMMVRISKAQMVYALQNNGLYGEIGALVENGFLPVDATSAESTGYKYRVVLAPDKATYYATAEPEVYGKSGKLSFLLELDSKKKAQFAAKDINGAALR
jgi:hypothetical protein